MAQLELHKYLNPKFSESCKEIARFYQSSKRLVNYPSIKKNFSKPKLSSNKFRKGLRYEQSTPVKSDYYDKLMNSYLLKGRVSSNPIKPRKRLDFNRHEFWLIDDKIQVIK
jgi:hypothetical protein